MFLGQIYSFLKQILQLPHFFFPQNTLARKQAQKMFEIICQKEGVEFLAWRDVPTDSSILGERAL